MTLVIFKKCLTPILGTVEIYIQLIWWYTLLHFQKSRNHMVFYNKLEDAVCKPWAQEKKSVEICPESANNCILFIGYFQSRSS